MSHPQDARQTAKTAAPVLFKPRRMPSPSYGSKAQGSPRKARLLQLLLDADGGNVARHVIAERVGCVNVADLVRGVKAAGVPIESSSREHTDRDGRRCRIGLYCLATDEARAKARQLLAMLG